MSGSERPTIFKFILNLKKDESIARSNIIKCLAGLAPPPREPKYVKRDAAIKQSIKNYIAAKEAEEEAKKAMENDDADEENDDDNIDLEEDGDSQQSGWKQTQDWSKTPEMILITSISHNSRL